MKFYAVLLVLGSMFLSIGHVDAQPSDDDIIAALTLSENVIDSIHEERWDRLYELTSPSFKERFTAQQVATELAQVIAAVGGLQFAMMSDGALLANGCQKREYAAQFANDVGKITVSTCKAGEEWGVAGVTVLPIIRATGEYIIRQQFESFFGKGAYYVDCEAGPDTEIGANFPCLALATDGSVFELILERTNEKGVKLAEHRILSGAVSEASTAELVALVKDQLARYSKRDFDNFFKQTAPNMKRDVGEQKVLEIVHHVHRALGPVKKSQLAKESSHPSGLPSLEMDLTFENGETGTGRFALIPADEKWRLFSFHFLPSSAQSQANMLELSLTHLARQLTKDSQASIQCDTQAIIDTNQDLECDGQAYGQDIRFLVTQDGGSYFVETGDFQTLVRSRLESVKEMLGWEFDSLECENKDPEPFDEVYCVAGSPDGDRQLRVFHRGNDLRVIGVSRL